MWGFFPNISERVYYSLIFKILGKKVLRMDQGYPLGINRNDFDTFYFWSLCGTRITNLLLSQLQFLFGSDSIVFVNIDVLGNTFKSYSLLNILWWFVFLGVENWARLVEGSCLVYQARKKNHPSQNPSNIREPTTSQVLYQALENTHLSGGYGGTWFLKWIDWGKGERLKHEPREGWEQSTPVF